MKKSLLILIIASALFSMFIFSGCSEKSPTKTEDTADIDMEWGGFTTADEATAFSDPQIIEEFATDDEDGDDEITIDQDVQDALNDSTSTVHFVRIVWGKLESDSNATEATTWNGSASMNKGVIAVLKKIRFEINDRIVRPRTDRQAVQWESETTMHYDGLLLALIDYDPAEAGINGELEITINDFSQTFSFSELDSMVYFETLTADSHFVSIVSFKKEGILAGGYLEGRWLRLTENGGRFYGRWINDLGNRAGYLKGIWGINNQGEKVWFGKYIGLNGTFLGLLGGHWEHINNNPKLAWMAGQWVNKSYTKAGYIKGFSRKMHLCDKRGFFHARFRRTM